MSRSDVSEFKYVRQALWFLNIHAAVYNLFNLGAWKQPSFSFSCNL